MENNMLSLITFTISIIILFIAMIIIFIKIKSMENFLKSTDMLPVSMSVESREKDICLIDLYLNRCFLKTLQEYLSKNLEFSENSPVQKYFSGKYCDLIQYLLRPDITFNFKFDDGSEETRSFFESFIEKVYLLFLAETPEKVKNIILKYFSGYTIETYFLKQKSKPSILPFVTESIRNKLWLRYTENEKNTQYMLQVVRSQNNGSDTDINYQSIISNYDAECIQKICLDIYNTYEPEIKSTVNLNKTQTTSTNTKYTTEKPNGFEVDFRVKPGEGEQK